MQTILTKLSDEQASKELKKFFIASTICTGISLIIFWWLAIAGLAFSGRTLLLTYHKGNKNRKNFALYRAGSLIVILLSLGILALYFSS